MKGRLAALDVLSDGRRIAALIADGVLVDLLVDPNTDTGAALPGAIFRAIAGRPMKGQGGIFVDLGEGETGYLRDARGIAPGQALLVQVTTVTEAGKAPPVVRRLVFRSRYAIVTPDRPGVNISRSIRDEDARDALQVLGRDLANRLPDGAGLVLRSASATADEEAIVQDVLGLSDLASRILDDAPGSRPERLLDAPDAHHAAWVDWADVDSIDDDPGSFDRNGVWEHITAALAAPVPLGAGHMMIEQTRALVAVDINTGGDTSPAAGLKVNVAALRALPRALRLRGLGGQVVVDLAPFPKKERAQLEQIASAAFRRENAQADIAGWSALGHLEIRKKRGRLPLTEVLKDVLPDL